MLNHTYTSVKNANLVDCGKKQHISSQPISLLKDNFLGEFRTELDKKKVLANLGIATDLSLEWEYIKGDIGRSVALTQELDSRTKYISKIGEFKDKIISIIEGIQYLETIVGGEQEGEDEQNNRLLSLENTFSVLENSLETLNKYLKETIEININKLEENLEDITTQVSNINNLIQISNKSDNALILITNEQLSDGETPGLYVPNLETRVKATENRFTPIESNIDNIQKNLDKFVTKEDLGGDSFDFVEQSDFDQYSAKITQDISNIQSELQKTVKTGEDGHVDTLYVNTISKNNNDDNIKITDSFEVETGVPLDVRFVVQNLEELTNLSVNVCYPGMGVIVNSLSSLYILRNPENNKLTQEYINNINNWKCPEDLVTVALSREEYESLEEINPNVFYYIFEEEIKRTSEPKQEEYGSEEEYQKAFQEWIDSLKILSQEYMSASWGVDIENKLGKKANQVSVNVLNDNIIDLQKQIELLTGGDNETSLKGLSERITNAESELDFLLGTEETDEEPSSKGKISEIEDSILELDNKIINDYVSKQSITSDNNETNYIFVKKSEYSEDMANRDLSLSKEVTTEILKSNQIETTQITLSGLEITSNDGNLIIDSDEVACIKDVPKIKYLTQEEYDSLSQDDIDPDTYYYTTNEEIYVIKSDFDNRITQLSNQINTMSSIIIELSNTIEELKNRIDVLENPSENSETTN